MRYELLDTSSENTEKYGEEEKKMTENIYNSNISNISSEQSKGIYITILFTAWVWGWGTRKFLITHYCSDHNLFTDMQF